MQPSGRELARVVQSNGSGTLAVYQGRGRELGEGGGKRGEFVFVLPWGLQTLLVNVTKRSRRIGGDWQDFCMCLRGAEEVR
jgi:hypothetical protein